MVPKDVDAAVATVPTERTRSVFLTGRRRASGLIYVFSSMKPAKSATLLCNNTKCDMDRKDSCADTVLHDSTAEQQFQARLPWS